jgi:hypothetical protein
MSPEEVVRERLVQTGAVTAIVSARIYQLKIPQNATFPAVRVQEIDEPSMYHLRGENGLTAARVQVDCFVKEDSSGDPYGTLRTLANATHDALSAQTFMNVGSPTEREVAACFRQNRRVMYEGDELRLLRMLQDYIVWSRAV